MVHSWVKSVCNFKTKHFSLVFFDDEGVHIRCLTLELALELLTDLLFELSQSLFLCLVLSLLAGCIVKPIDKLLLELILLV